MSDTSNINSVIQAKQVNEKQAHRIRKIVEDYGTDGLESNAIGMLADIMHVVNIAGLDVDTVLVSAEASYNKEIEKESG